MDKLMPEQVDNWRKVLSGQFGPYALIMPVEQIEKLRDRMQGQVNQLDKGYTEREKL